MLNLDIDAEVLAISVDSHFSHLAWMNQPRNQGGISGIQIPLVSDLTKEISKDYGVLVENREDELFGASLRGLFIIDGKGKKQLNGRYHPITDDKRCTGW